MPSHPERSTCQFEPDPRSGWRFSLHGVQVEVVGRDPAILARVHAVFDHFGLTRSGTAADPAALRFTLSEGAGGLSLPSEAREIARHDDLRAWTVGSCLYLTCDGHTVRLDRASRCAHAALPSSPSAVRKDIVIYSLLLLLRRLGRYALHASGVSRDGDGCLFVAGSGHGKSTQTYGLVRHGWRLLSDDAILLRSRDERVEALALRRNLGLDPGLADCFPELAVHGRPDPFVARGKLCLDVRALCPDRLVERCIPRVCVFPEIVSLSASRLLPLGAEAALPRLIVQSAVFALDPEVAPFHLDMLQRLARQVSSYRLLAGTDLRRDPGRLAAMLSDLDALPPNPPPA